MIYATFINFSSDLKSDPVLVVQMLKQSSWLDSSCFYEQFGYKTCIIWILESAILNHLKNRQRTKTDEQQFCKKRF
jgi:hypothetical protein